jgi:sortase (surface protein transpeptidase)
MRKKIIRLPLFVAVLFIGIASVYQSHNQISHINGQPVQNVTPSINQKTSQIIQSVLPVVSEASAATIAPKELPKELIIPVINADIPVIEVGVTKTNIMDTPHNFTQAGWYNLGTIPGQMGSAVINAHVDNGGSIPGVFKHLRDLQVSDDIYVITKQGSKIHFKVINSQAYAYKDVPMDDIVHRNDGAYLRLITCHGTWLPAKNTYDQRLVVTAVLAE